MTWELPLALQQRVGFGLAHDRSSYLADPYWLDGPARDADSLGQTTGTIHGPIDRALAQARRNGPEGKVWLIGSRGTRRRRCGRRRCRLTMSRQSRVSQ
jgi:hypothetical protein